MSHSVDNDAPQRVARVLTHLAQQMHDLDAPDDVLRSTIDGWAAGLLGAVDSLQTAHDHDAAGCLDCHCNAAPWSSRTPCTCPIPPEETRHVAR